ncbi:hypothetical protein LNM86_12410 [Bartonella machadoae]|nr:hypothetical protein [Bartonella machadoae]UNE54291.1 hypothetical protein LNM86_12410 [Bartonella machadoae]
MGKNRLERNKNAPYEPSQYQGLSQHWGAANSMIVPACTFISVKMVVLNGFYAIRRGMIKLQKKEKYASFTEKAYF